MLNTDKLCMGCMNENGGQSICPACGYDSSQGNGKNKLPIKFVLGGRYVIGRVISENSESTTYIAFDGSQDTAVTVREYFPEEFAVRQPDKTVSIIEGKSFAFNEGLMQFMELNTRLMTLELACVNRVTDVFEENGTAYSVSAVISGITLEEFLSRNGGSLRWEQVRSLILPLIDTVKALHDAGIVHGAISPETVIVCRDGKLKLSDMAISEIRRCDGEFTPKIYNGYASPEQYGVEGLTLGTYTDVYGLSAMLFRVIIGVTPPAANDRMNNDALSVPAKFANELPRQVLVALADGMQLMPEHRTHDIESFKNELVYGETGKNKKSAIYADADSQNSDKGKSLKSMSTGKAVAISAGITAGVCILIILIILLINFIGEKNNSSNNPINSDTSDMPSTDNIGDIDPNAVQQHEITYDVLDYKGKTLSEIVEDDANKHFKFVIVGDEHSDKYARGQVVKQSVSAGTAVKNDTTIELTVSSGPEKIKMKSVVGYTKDEALLILFKQGFSYENIEFIEKYDPSAQPSVVITQDVKSGTSIGIYEKIVLGYNTYEGEEDTDYYTDDYNNDYY